MKLEFSPYIAIQVSDHQKAVEFYQKVLGMEFVDSKGNDAYLDKDGINFVFENNTIAPETVIENTTVILNEWNKLAVLYQKMAITSN